MSFCEKKIVLHNLFMQMSSSLFAHFFILRKILGLYDKSILCMCPVSICITERFSRNLVRNLCYRRPSQHHKFNFLKSVCHGGLTQSCRANDKAVTEFRIVKWCIVIDIGNVGTLHACFFPCYFFDLENLGVMSLRNIGCLSTYYTALCTRSPGFETGSVMWDFVEDRVALG
jgi:hypothetical protein